MQNELRAKKSARLRQIKKLNDFIWQLKDNCETINKVNEQLIMQYCRFTVLADELSIEISEKADIFTENELENKIITYEKFQKMSINLYKILKFDSIQKELMSKDNPFAKLLEEAKKDGDF